MIPILCESCNDGNFRRKKMEGCARLNLNVWNRNQDNREDKGGKVNIHIDELKCTEEQKQPLFPLFPFSPVHNSELRDDKAGPFMLMTNSLINNVACFLALL